MKKFLLLSFVLIYMLTGCQESPESDIIVNKNEDRLEQAIKEENTEEAEVETQIREHKEDSFETTTGDTTVVVDAEVKSVDAPMPVIRVTPHEINSDELKTWAGNVIENETWYDPGAPKSRKVLEQEILEWKEMESHLEEQYEGEGLENAKKQYEESIRNLEKACEEAGDNGRVRTESDFMFHPAQYYMDESIVISEDDKLAKDMQFQAETEYENGIKWELSSTNRSETDYGMHTLACFVLDKDEKQHPHVKCSAEDARQLAEGILERLEMKDWKIIDMAESDDGQTCRHTFFCTRYYEEVPTISNVSIDLQADDMYAANLYYEDLHIEIENGELGMVEWTSPMDIVEVENRNVKVMSFDEVYECFEEQMKNQYSKNTYIENGWFENDTTYQSGKLELKITDIEQGLFRIKIKDNTEEYRMVPAWIFRGHTLFNGEPLGGDASWKDNYLAINAIDGSVINMNLGY